MCDVRRHGLAVHSHFAQADHAAAEQIGIPCRVDRAAVGDHDAGRHVVGNRALRPFRRAICPWGDDEGVDGQLRVGRAWQNVNVPSIRRVSMAEDASWYGVESYDVPAEITTLAPAWARGRPARRWGRSNFRWPRSCAWRRQAGPDSARVPTPMCSWCDRACHRRPACPRSGCSSSAETKADGVYSAIIWTDRRQQLGRARIALPRRRGTPSGTRVWKLAN